MKKIYFLTKATGDAADAKWRNRLKNTSKSADAARDIVKWDAEGREFFVSIENHISGKREVFHLNPQSNSEVCADFASGRPVLSVIEAILLLPRGQDIDISLSQRRFPEKDVDE